MLSTRHPPLLNWRLMLGGWCCDPLYQPQHHNSTTTLRARGGQRAQVSGLGINFPSLDFMLHVCCRIDLRKYAEHHIDNMIWTVYVWKVHTKYCNVLNWTYSGCHFLNLLSLQLALHSHCTACSIVFWEILRDNNPSNGSFWSMINGPERQLYACLMTHYNPFGRNFCCCLVFELCFSLGSPPVQQADAISWSWMKMQNWESRMQTGPSAGLSDELC